MSTFNVILVFYLFGILAVGIFDVTSTKDSKTLNVLMGIFLSPISLVILPFRIRYLGNKTLYIEKSSIYDGVKHRNLTRHRLIPNLEGIKRKNYVVLWSKYNWYIKLPSDIFYKKRLNHIKDDYIEIYDIKNQVESILNLKKFNL